MIDPEDNEPSKHAEDDAGRDDDTDAGESIGASFEQFGTAVTREGGSRKNPKTQFALAARADIAAILRGEASGRMFKRRDRGDYVVTLRNGTKVMEVVPGKKDFIVASNEKVSALLNHAIMACEKGELDSIFAAQARP